MMAYRTQQCRKAVLSAVHRSPLSRVTTCKCSITKYDVQDIEALTCVTLEAYAVDEAAALKGLTQVFEAKRATSMRAAASSP